MPDPMIVGSARTAIGKFGGGLAEVGAPSLGAVAIRAALARSGVDFDAQDGQRARLVILTLTPEDDLTAQLEILSDIGRTFREPGAVEEALRATTYTEFLSLLRATGSA